MLVSLEGLLRDANRENRAVPCFNVFNLNFLYSIMVAAEEKESPVIISLNQDMVNRYSLEILVPLLLAFAHRARIPVCPHLDHTYDPEVIQKALELGMPSVMYDGSQLPLEENIRVMQEIGEQTRKYNASLEGEVGSVAYADNDPKKAHIRNEATRPEDAVRMAEEGTLNALAVSVGNVHRLSETSAEIDLSLLTEISDKVSLPLVIHGTSGIPHPLIKKIARETSVAKFNIATDLRRVWGETLRRDMVEDPQLYDPLECSRRVETALGDRVRYWIELLR